ncbi:hypothetical protein [Nitrosospira multiformis]|uniref:Uncharacterized protein n=1 Tax=Nitrosospira multiformis TaxID=1231 RepID=A0A1I7FTV2_9PROT|nr:hypothetical protein [Nitrosospira multiformis]SFU39580.1 hypothetical protein SAMN05216417_102211 [Nitrosospira multiformis]
MAANGNNSAPSTASFAGKHPELANDNPESFRQAPPHHREFDLARDPYIARQIRAMEQTEAQRRGESERSGGGSQMVKRDKPFPQLRPEFEQAPIRETFNRAWLREQREARLADLSRQREQHRTLEQPEYAIQRDREMAVQKQRVPQR